MKKHRVVIIGGGFGGLYAAQSLRRAKDVEVTLIDRRNFHLFQPLLYQVATAGLSPANIAAPLRAVLNKQKNARVLMAEVTGIDANAREVILKEGDRVPYDTLIVATGARHDYFGHPEWERIAPGLKTIEDATAIRRRIFESFELAERSSDPEQIRQLLTFVIVGAGPTGVELAGALSEITRDTLRHDFRRIDPRTARIVLVDASDRVLGAMHPELSEKARAQVERLGVEVLTNAKVVDLKEGQVSLVRDGKEEVIRANTILWAAGVRASPLGQIIADATGAKLDRAGRVLIEPNLGVPGHPEIMVIGDLARLEQDGKPLPGVATVAMQQGEYAARRIREQLRGQALPPFRYHDKGSMATIGRAAAVADIKGFRFSGYFAWILWLFVHLMYIIAFANRILVMVQWAWQYLTFGRGARLITGEERENPPLPAPPGIAKAEREPPRPATGDESRRLHRTGV
ncbi:MAG TPA: NAD(P)/FAD-dependent oxidoreductase [Planctomycetota bacterium]|nr:NAD(P)/FAD-dependent oxidoreductase [Planctomycetota bacterium]